MFNALFDQASLTQSGKYLGDYCCQLEKRLLQDLYSDTSAIRESVIYGGMAIGIPP